MTHSQNTHSHTHTQACAHIALQAAQLNWHFLTKKLLFSPLLAIYIIISYISTDMTSMLEQNDVNRQARRAKEKHMWYINCTRSRSRSTNANEKIYRWLLWMKWNTFGHRNENQNEKFTTVSVQRLILKNCCRAETEFNEVKEPSSIETETSRMSNMLCYGAMVWWVREVNFVINGMSFSHRTMTLIDSCIRHLCGTFFISRLELYRQRVHPKKD